METTINKTDLNQFIIESLRKNKLKVTTPRVEVYKYLLTSKEHPTAEMVYSNLKPNNPNLSLGTVYKTLETFKSLGLILGFNLGESKFRYDGNISQHSHFYCNSCETVFDVFTSPSFDDDLLEDFKITNFQGFLYGMCKNCSN